MLAVSTGCFADRDGTTACAWPADRKDEAGLLIYRFNRLAETLRRERMDLYQRELVPETILAASPRSWW